VSLKLLSREKIDLAAEKAKTDVRIFVGGPFIEPNNKRAPARTLYDGASHLRYKICRHISDGTNDHVSIGENAKLIEVYKGHFGSLYDASTLEVNHVRDHCDAVIIIPSSPGSFCELGYFSAVDEITRKMLILLNKKFERKPGYLHFGPATQAKLNGATVETVDYGDIRGSLEVVMEFVEFIRSKKLSMRHRVV
jgi:hypothetical protein